MWPLNTSDRRRRRRAARRSAAAGPRIEARAERAACPASALASGSNRSTSAPAAGSRSARYSCSAASSRGGSPTSRAVVSKRDQRQRRARTSSSPRARSPSQTRCSASVSGHAATLTYGRGWDEERVACAVVAMRLRGRLCGGGGHHGHASRVRVRDLAPRAAARPARTAARARTASVRDADGAARPRGRARRIAAARGRLRASAAAPRGVLVFLTGGPGSRGSRF